MKLRKKRQGVNRFGTCCFIMLLFFIFSTTVIEMNGCIVNAKAKEGTRIKVIKQDIGGKEQIIGCSHENCIIHQNKRYGEKGCASGSDLFNIQVKTKENGKIKYKSLYKMEFISMQGGCIKGNSLYLAFSDVGKSTPKKEDLTAIVRINLKESKVKKVTLIRGAVEKNIDGLGHANDLTYQNGKFHAAWYLTKGTGKTYSNKIGYINKQITGKGIGAKFSTKMGKTMISAFGIAAYPKKLVALGIRYEDKKMHRYISTYTIKKPANKKSIVN